MRRWRTLDGGWHRLRYGYRHHFADFAIRRDGGEVLAYASDGISGDELASVLESVVLGGAVRLLGRTCLHGTVVTAGRRAVVLMGQSGAGKSSLAWALMRQGCRLLSDDFATLDLSDGKLFVHPGRTKLRLWPDVARHLPPGSGCVTRLYPLVAKLEKLAVTDPDAIACAPTCVHAIYLLDRRQDGLGVPLIEALPPGEGLAKLAANLYGSIVPETEARRTELATLAEVAAAIRIHRLRLPDSLDALPAVARQLRSRLFA